MTNTRTRFAPSPTGTPESIHLGFVIRALWNYAYAKKNSGQFILRIEDTDQKRSRKDTEEEIYKVLKMFGIFWTEGPDIGGPHAPYRQSERLKKYQEAAHELVKNGHAYYDFDAVVREKEEIKESYDSEEKLKALKIKPAARNADPKESLKRVSEGESFVVRIKMPENRKFRYKDWILKKEIEFDSNEVSDMILLKSDGFPTYHLAVVVDDLDMEISHVFRGQEWISSTPIHLYLYEAFGKPVPEIGHFSVILDPRTGKKFSKRDASALFGVKTWLDKGYLPEAILNYLMLLGWAPKNNQEIFSLDEFVQAFDRDGVQKANPVFDVKKLDWFNSQYIQKLSEDDFVKLITSHSSFKDEPNFENITRKTYPFMKSRMVNVSEYDRLVGFLYNTPEVDKSLFGQNSQKHLEVAKNVFEDMVDWNLENLNEKLMQKVKENEFNTGEFFMDLRIVLTGMKFTPPINECIVILGKDETLSRIEKLL